MILLSLLILFGTAFATPVPTEPYSNELVLKEPDIYYLFWTYNDTDILMETHVKTTGWAAFGISPTGGMDNSDVVVSWLKTDGTYHFTDRHIRGRKVIVDQTQNWFPISVFQKDGYLVTKFSRKIRICDESNEDLDIPTGTPKTIFAFGTILIDDDIGYHGMNRGIKSVPLISSLNNVAKFNLDEVDQVEYRVNVS